MTKEKVIETIKGLPEHFDLDVLMERLLFVEKVEKGLEQLRNGEYVDHEDVKKMVAKWKK
jgi:hypothetical protein